MRSSPTTSERPAPAAPVRRRRLVVAGWVAVAVVVVCWGMPRPVEAGELEVGVLAGGGWNLLSQPTDPPGAPTFLWGSAFTGTGTVAGPTMRLNLAESNRLALDVTTDLLHGYHRGTGYADHGDGGRIEVMLTTNVLRIPVLARVRGAGETVQPTFGAGIEPVVGLASNAHYETTGVESSIREVETTSGTTVSGVVAAGLDVQAGRNRVVPVDLRVAWNPFVGSSTEERFQDFESADQPGAYRVVFDWQVLITAGVRWQ